MLGLGLSLTTIAIQGRRPSLAALFANGEPGVWYDPSDLSSMYQDAAGTIPAVYGQPVGLILDKSGNGNHASQSIATARPTLGRVPKGGRNNGGRNNMFLSSDDVAGAGWYGAYMSIEPSLDGKGKRIIETVETGIHQISQILSGLKDNEAGSFSVKVKPAGRNIIRFFMFDADSGSNYIHITANLTTDTVTSGIAGGGLILGAPPISAPDADGYRTISGSFIANTAGTGGGVRFQIRLLDDGAEQSYTGDGVSGFAVYQFMAYPGTTPTPYQRVVSEYDVTEVGISSLSYLSFDGVDDFLVTPTITPGTDKVQAFVGVRKLSDAASGTLIEASVLYGGSSGTLMLRAPAAPDATYAFYSRGQVSSIAVASGYPAPITNVTTGLGDIAGASTILRVNGTQVATGAADQGTGNYLAYPLYIGRRAGTSIPFNGRLYGLAVRFGPNLTPEQISQAEVWMARRTGVTL